MSKKTGPQHGPYQQDNGAELPSRRRLLLGMSMMSGALALGGAKIARAADCPTPNLQPRKMNVGKSSLSTDSIKPVY